VAHSPVKEEIYRQLLKTTGQNIAIEYAGALPQDRAAMFKVKTSDSPGPKSHAAITGARDGTSTYRAQGIVGNCWAAASCGPPASISLQTAPGTSTSCQSCPSNASWPLRNKTISGEELTTTRSMGIVQLATQFFRRVLERRYLETR
jgi:hypothetical protein